MKKLCSFVVVTLFFSTILFAQGYQVGDVAADFRLKNVDGTLVSLNDYPDVRGFIVVFFCDSCISSQIYADRLSELDQKYRPQGYPVIIVSDDSMYDVTEAPFVCVLEKTPIGNIVRYVGVIDDSPKDPLTVKRRYVADAVDTLILENTPSLVEPESPEFEIKH